MNGRHKQISLLICFVGRSNCRWVKSGEQKVLNRASWNRIFCYMIQFKYKSFLVLIKGVRSESESKISFISTGVWELPLRTSKSKVAWFRGCRVFVDDKGTSDWFRFCWGLMLLWVMGVGFENTCTVSEKCNFSRVVWRFYGWVYPISKLYLVLAGCSLVVVSVGYHAGGTKFNSCWQLIFNSCFTKFVSRSSGLWSWGNPCWGLWNWWSKFSYH